MKQIIEGDSTQVTSDEVNQLYLTWQHWQSMWQYLQMRKSKSSLKLLPSSWQFTILGPATRDVSKHTTGIHQQWL